ncbi:MAG: Gfo/Idh/MocA family oxidoreductase [Hyphomicrobiales bacterium]|nr:Gfo/Idh/MocA family oxidoreductase [Hyphomicrobiales bacterium]
MIGAGLAAETHARELAAVEGAELYAVFARDREKVEKFRATFPARKTFSDYGLFLSDPAIDAVIVATPNGLHLDYAIAAAKAGKDVVVEKPLEKNAQRASEIVDACRASGVRLFVIYQMRFSKAAIKAKNDIVTGKLGRIILFNVVDNEYRTPEYYARDAWRGTREFEGGGCLITQTTHLLDLIQHLAGPVASVFAQTATAVHAIETEDVAVATVRFANGALGTISSSTAAFPGHRHLVTIIGTAGSISFNSEHDQIVFRRSKHDDEKIDVPAEFSLGDPSEPRDYPTLRQRLQLQRISDVIAGKAEDGEDGNPLAAVHLLDAIYLSAREGREVAISEIVGP